MLCLLPGHFVCCQNALLPRHFVARLARALCCQDNYLLSRHFSVVGTLCYQDNLSAARDHLVGLVVKASASRAEDLGFESRLRWDFSGSNHTSGLKIGIPVATLPGAWHYRVSTGTGQPGVSIL